MSASAALAAWSAAAEAAKISEPLARYRAAAGDAGMCAVCGWHDGGECLIVAGVTGDQGTCDLWKPAKPNLEDP